MVSDWLNKLPNGEICRASTSSVSSITKMLSQGIGGSHVAYASAVYFEESRDVPEDDVDFVTPAEPLVPLRPPPPSSAPPPLEAMKARERLALKRILKKERMPWLNVS
jgi:hypothetical protein